VPKLFTYDVLTWSLGVPTWRPATRVLRSTATAWFSLHRTERTNNERNQSILEHTSAYETNANKSRQTDRQLRRGNECAATKEELGGSDERTTWTRHDSVAWLTPLDVNLLSVACDPQETNNKSGRERQRINASQLLMPVHTETMEMKRTDTQRGATEIERLAYKDNRERGRKRHAGGIVEVSTTTRRSVKKGHTKKHPRHRHSKGCGQTRESFQDTTTSTPPPSQVRAATKTTMAKQHARL
jgi:hypothetical protein